MLKLRHKLTLFCTLLSILCTAPTQQARAIDPATAAAAGAGLLILERVAGFLHKYVSVDCTRRWCELMGRGWRACLGHAPAYHLIARDDAYDSLDSGLRDLLSQVGREMDRRVRKIKGAYSAYNHEDEGFSAYFFPPSRTMAVINLKTDLNHEWQKREMSFIQRMGDMKKLGTYEEAYRRLAKFLGASNPEIKAKIKHALKGMMESEKVVFIKNEDTGEEILYIGDTHAEGFEPYVMVNFVHRRFRVRTSRIDEDDRASRSDADSLGEEDGDDGEAPGSATAHDLDREAAYTLTPEYWISKSIMHSKKAQADWELIMTTDPRAAYQAELSRMTAEQVIDALPPAMQPAARRAIQTQLGLQVTPEGSVSGASSGGMGMPMQAVMMRRAGSDDSLASAGAVQRVQAMAAVSASRSTAVHALDAPRHVAASGAPLPRRVASPPTSSPLPPLIEGDEVATASGTASVSAHATAGADDAAKISTRFDRAGTPLSPPDGARIGTGAGSTAFVGTASPHGAGVAREDDVVIAVATSMDVPAHPRRESASSGSTADGTAFDARLSVTAQPTAHSGVTGMLQESAEALSTRLGRRRAQPSDKSGSSGSTRETHPDFAPRLQQLGSTGGIPTGMTYAAASFPVQYLEAHSGRVASTYGMMHPMAGSLAPLGSMGRMGECRAPSPNHAMMERIRQERQRDRERLATTRSSAEDLPPSRDPAIHRVTIASGAPKDASGSSALRLRTVRARRGGGSATRTGSPSRAASSLFARFGRSARRRAPSTAPPAATMSRGGTPSSARPTGLGATPRIRAAAGAPEAGAPAGGHVLVDMTAGAGGSAGASAAAALDDSDDTPDAGSRSPSSRSTSPRSHRSHSGDEEMGE